MAMLEARSHACRDADKERMVGKHSAEAHEVQTVVAPRGSAQFAAVLRWRAEDDDAAGRVDRLGASASHIIWAARTDLAVVTLCEDFVAGKVEELTGGSGPGPERMSLGMSNENRTGAADGGR